ncbi:MAG: ATP-dependent helicase, partial [Pseudomonadota bacterium]|nr:ATP-dependent helicase [Pseudomonadota bacterium]
IPEDYVHRIGRTGRAGLEGEAISLVSADEIKHLRNIELLIKQNIVRREREGFEPQHVLPESRISNSGHKRKVSRAQRDHNSYGGTVKRKKYNVSYHSSRSKSRKTPAAARRN